MKKNFLIGIILLFAIWWVVATVHVLDALFLPGPVEVIIDLAQMLAAGTLNADIYATLLRLGLAFGLAIIIGIPLGILLGASTKIYESVEFIIDFFRSLPATAIFPLFLLVFGIDDSSKIAVAAFGAALVIIFNTAHGVMNTKPSRIIAAKLMGAKKLQIFKSIVFWESLPQTFIGIRTSISLALIIIIVTEMFIGTYAGLGRRIIDFQYIYNVKGMFGIILLTGIIGYALNLILAKIEDKVVHWKGK